MKFMLRCGIHPYLCRLGLFLILSINEKRENGERFLFFYFANAAARAIYLSISAASAELKYFSLIVV